MTARAACSLPASPADPTSPYRNCDQLQKAPKTQVSPAVSTMPFSHSPFLPLLLHEGEHMPPGDLQKGAPHTLHLTD